MPSPADFQKLAYYNQWMNTKVFEATGMLCEDQQNQDTGAYFGSVTGTLNHIVVGDIIWLSRFAAHQHHFSSLEPVQSLPVPGSLNAVLYPDFTDLRRIRRQLDSVIIAFADELTEQALAAPLAYHNTKGDPYTKQFGDLLMHFFNHQTHHRGQVTTLLSQQGIDPGVTDLLALLPDVPSQ